MTRPSLQVTQRDVGDVTVLDLNGLLVLDDGDVVFRDAVNALLARGRQQFVVNLNDVTYIDSAGIGMLISRFLAVKRLGGDMRLANLTSRSHRVMTITHLLTVFDAFDNVDDAVQSFTHPTASI